MKKVINRLLGRYSKAQQKFTSFPSQVYGGSSSTLSVEPKRALYYYETVAPINTAIDMICDEVSSLDIIAEDVKTEELIYDHPLLSLLKAPNADLTQGEFIKQLSVFYAATGNCFLLATGPVNRPPAELFVINPSTVELVEGDDGFLEKIKVHGTQGETTTYSRQEVDGRFRYFNGGEAELWHIKSFHPRYGAGQLWGLPQLSSISLEIEQYIEASVHNLSLLKRGARPSGAVKVGEMLTDDQYQRLQHQLERFYSGSHNAGRSMILEGGDFIQMSQTNKDMDFATLKKTITETIYSALNIPLVLVSTDAATYNNLSLAQLSFYDNTVLPLSERLLLELTAFLMHRYGKKREIILRYDREEILALEPRRTQQIKFLQESNVLTTNEVRKLMGYDPLPGGDTLYIDSNKMALEDASLEASAAEARALMDRDKE
jgi:HK97 family phage portal protein